MAKNAAPTGNDGTGRMEIVDLARGVALIAMTAFHFSWDLGMFGYIEPAAMFRPFPVWAARTIAGTFLFLVGVSLWLAHSRSIRWRPFLWRLAMVSGAAALITLTTWMATPDAFIFFGILHSIAFASLAGLLFLQLPWWASAATGLFVLLSRGFLRSELLDAPFWWWSGLSAVTPVSNDYVPVFPFFGMVLLGIAAAALAHQRGLLMRLAKVKPRGRLADILRFLGRHSLVYYLAHQPVMIALFYAVAVPTGRI